MEEEHYVFLIGFAVVGWGSYSDDDEALERAKIIVREKGGLVGFYRQIGATNIPAKEGKECPN